LTTCTVILAGGRSRRMGRDKALLVCNGKTLLQRAWETATALPYPVILSTAPGRSYPLPASVTVAEDLYPGYGPLGAMASVMQQYAYDRYLFIPVDMPRLNSAVLQPLLEPETEGMVIARAGERLYPVPAVLHATTTSVLLHQIQEKNLRLRHLIDLIPTKIIPFEEGLPYFANINTPDDLKRCQEE